MAKSTEPIERFQLIRARERLGLSGVQLAKKLGVVKSTVNKIEAGISHPSLALMQRWVQVLGPGASMDLFWAPGARARREGRAQRSPDAAA
jgi:transcriptional regulator with XRE-family HTH domain